MPYRLRSRLIHEVVRVICEEEPTRPSTAITETEQRSAPGDEKPIAVTPQSVSRTRAATPAVLRRQLSGDPDRILLKALRKEPAQRYRTAEAFSEDVRRHLDGLPVLAQGESLVYRTGKLLQLYRGWAIAAAALVAALAGGLVKLNDPGMASVILLFLVGTGSYYVIRKQYDHNIATRMVLRFAEIFVTFLILWGVYVWLSGGPERWSLMIMFTIVGLLLANSMARWLFRARWTGPLLLDLTAPKDRRRAYVWASVASVLTVLLGGLVYWANTLPGVPHMGHFDRIFVVFVAFPFLALLVAHGFLTTGRIDLRQRGIIVSGIWLPWSKIESYAWEETGGESVALKVRSTKWLLFTLGSVLEIILSAAQKGAADAVLKSQLSEWPGS